MYNDELDESETRRKIIGIMMTMMCKKLGGKSKNQKYKRQSNQSRKDGR